MLFEKNLEALKDKIDKVYDAIADKDIQWSKDVAETEAAKNGELIVSYKLDDKTYYLNSRYNPTREAEKFMQDMLGMPDESVLIMFGFSNGMFVREFLNKNTNKNKIVIYEPSLDIFMRVLTEIDVSDVLADKRVHIVVAGLNDNMFDFLLLHYLAANNIKTNQYADLPMYAQLFPDAYKEYRRVIKEKFENLCIEMNTINIMGKRMTYTGINNMRFLPGCRSGKDYEGIFPEDMPAIVVSAGPSLEKNVELLKEIKGRALIVVVDTAIKAVVSRGIKPDMIISVDNNKELKNFEVDGLEDIYFLADMGVTTDALEMVKPKNLIFYSSDSVVWDKLFKKQNSELWMIYSGGSVALDALSLMIAWGFKKVILIGQDLALTGNKQYADGREVGDDDFAKKNLLYVKDIYGNDILTKKDYFTFIRSIEDIGFRFPEVEIIDATEGGAFKKNTTIMTLRDAIDQYCTQTYDLETMIASVPRLFEGENRGLVIEALEDMKHNIRNLGKKMSRGAADCKKAGLMLSRGDYNVKELKKINATIGKLDKEYVEMDEYSLIKKFVAKDEYQFVSTVYLEEEDNIQDSIKLYQKSEAYYRVVAEASPKIVEIIEACLEKMKEGV